MNTISSKKAVIYALYLPTKNMKKKNLLSLLELPSSCSMNYGHPNKGSLNAYFTYSFLIKKKKTCKIGERIECMVFLE